MTSRERALAAAACAAVGLWGLQSILLRPLFDWKSDLEGRVVKLAARVARGEALIAQSAVWRKRANRGAAPEIHSMNGLTKEVDRLAREVGVRIKEFRPDGPKERIQVAVTTEAPWGSLSRFGYRLSTESETLRIEKVEIQRVGENDGALRGRFVIALKDREL